MNTYKIQLYRYDIEDLVCAETASKARYAHFLRLDDCFESFSSYLLSLKSCRCLRKARKEDYFRKDHDFERIKNYRGVPLADYGTDVELSGRRGFIVGINDSCNFDVQFENGIFNCHPNYELVYFDEHGNVLYDFRKRKEAPDGK